MKKLENVWTKTIKELKAERREREISKWNKIHLRDSVAPISVLLGFVLLASGTFS